MKRQKLAPFRLRFRTEAIEKMCVFRIWAGEKYFIWKGKSFPDAAYYISETIDRTLRKPECKGSEIVSLLVKEIEDNRHLFVEVEAVHYASSPFDLLFTEYSMLQDAKGDPNCLNKQFLPHLPKWIPEVDINAYQSKIINKHKS